MKTRVKKELGYNTERRKMSMVKTQNSVFQKYGIPPKINFCLHQTREGYWVESPTLPGLYTQGDTIDKLISNLEDAILTYFDVPRGRAKQLSGFLEMRFSAEAVLGTVPGRAAVGARA